MAPIQRNPKNLLKKRPKQSTGIDPQNPAPKGAGNNGNGGKKGPNKFFMPGGTGFMGNFITIIIIFLLLMSAYSLIASDTKPKQVVSLSQVANDIKAGQVTAIKVTDNDLLVSYTGGVQKTSMKDPDDALPQTLVPYGVTPDQLSKVALTIATDTGFMYWFMSLAPLLIPAFLLAVLFWFLARQVRGAGMQAFTFGQSKARMIDPSDTNSRVTFADVAGAKEAKEELMEIVDFLKNPKKFLDIGARIPKGILLMGAPGTGKCVTGDTLLLTNKGIIPIDEVPKYFTVHADSTVEGLDIVSADPKSITFDSIAASHWYDLGEQETRIIETELGSHIEGTPEHPIVVLDEEGHMTFKHLADLSEGEHVVMARGSNVYGSYTKIPDADASYMLGVLVGDGCLTVKDRICLSTADAEVLAKVQKTSLRLLGKEFTKATGTYDYELRSHEAKTIVRGWGLEETYARNKHVPEWVRIAPKNFVTAFLRGLFDTDGGVERSGSVNFSSSSNALVLEVQALLLNIGVVARVSERKKKYNGTLQFYLTIYGDFVEKFQEEIGFSIERKKASLERLVERQRNTNINLVPGQQSQIKAVWQSAATFEHRNREFYSQGLYKNAKRYISGERTPSLQGLQTFIAGVETLAPAAVLSPEIVYLRRLASGDFFFTKISRISSGRAKVYDLTVPQRHNFVANGFINHNTLLARAVAGEAGVPFYSISGSEFVEMFVGVGASRVRDLFKMAKSTAPSIIFVDEIDAVGRARGSGVGGGNDEREQTLNQILVEMDGFEPTEKVIVMAATNRPDVLDPALLRPGRFDRRVTIDLPDRKDREEILAVHSRKKPFGPDVHFPLIAERTPGFSGAELSSLMNEAAILAARESRKEITQFDLIRSIEKVMLGPERKSHLLSLKEKKITAYHEAGHALVSSVLPYADPVHKISIISRGSAGGYTMKLPFEDKKMPSKKEFIDDIATLLGGYAAEVLIFDDVTTGPSNDLAVATNVARNMVARYGMSDTIGPAAFASDRAYAPESYSQDLAAKIDNEVSRIVEDGKKKATEVIIQHRDALDAIANALVEVETLERDDFEKILILNHITPKKKEDYTDGAVIVG
jgi:ATP-dependent metalloprotease FtsH